MKKLVVVLLIVLILTISLCGCGTKTDGICDECGQEMVVKNIVNTTGNTKLIYYCPNCGSNEAWHY